MLCDIGHEALSASGGVPTVCAPVLDVAPQPEQIITFFDDLDFVQLDEDDDA